MIEFQGVGKTYRGKVHALQDVNFRIAGGDFVFLIGESGAGKSTLIKLLNCEERPSTGRVMLEHFDVGQMKRQYVPILRRKIGMIFQDFRLIDSKTVYENVAFAMQIVGAREALIRQRVPMVLHLVGLAERADDSPSELSGGEAQRVGIARAIVNNPRLILADEPTGNLDVVNSQAIMGLLQEINAAGTTVLTCTHDVDLVRQMNKRVIELSGGRIIKDVLPQALSLGQARFDQAYAKLDRQTFTEMVAQAKALREAERGRRPVSLDEAMGRKDAPRAEARQASLAERLMKQRLEEAEGEHGA